MIVLIRRWTLNKLFDLYITQSSVQNKRGSSGFRVDFEPIRVDLEFKSTSSWVLPPELTAALDRVQPGSFCRPSRRDSGSIRPSFSSGSNPFQRCTLRVCAPERRSCLGNLRFGKGGTISADFEFNCRNNLIYYSGSPVERLNLKALDLEGSAYGMPVRSQQLAIMRFIMMDQTWKVLNPVKAKIPAMCSILATNSLIATSEAITFDRLLQAAR